MSGFEYIFTFYGLLLGLAVANAVGNLAEMWRSNEAVKVGLAPPVLCVFILLAAAQQWVSFWAARDGLTMTPINLLMCIGMAVPYTFVSHGMTPAREGSSSFEQFYLDHRKTLMAVLAIPPVLSLVYNLAFPSEFDVVSTALSAAFITAPRTVIPLVLAFSRSIRMHAIGLALLCAHTLWRLFL
jgi:hypothetical protein